MKKSTMGMIAGSTALLSAGTVMAVSKMKNKDEEKESNLSGSSNSPDESASPNIDDEARKDQIPSPDADEVEAEEGLTLLDHQYRSQWQANGFPQTHKEMRELEKGENDKEEK